MRTRPRSTVSGTDVALLRSLARHGSVVDASRRLGISRDRATYRLARLARAFGGPVVRGVRGGSEHGGTLLTPLGDRIARGGFEAVDVLDGRPVLAPAPVNVFRGRFVRGPPAELRVGPTLRLRVAFAAPDGAEVAAVLDPEAVLLARRRFPSSARNVLGGVVRAIGPARRGAGRTVLVRCAGQPIRVALTEEAIRGLHLARGSPVWLYVKATALRPVASHGRAGGGRRAN